MLTRLQIRDYVRFRTDTVESTSNPSNASLNTLLQIAGKRVVHELALAGYPYKVIRLNLTSTANEYLSGAATGAITILKVVRVENNREIPLKRYNGEADGDDTVPGPPREYAVAVDQANNNQFFVKFYPRQVSSDVLRVYYLENVDVLGNDADLFPGPVKAAEMVGLLVSSWVLKKEGERADASDCLAEYEDNKREVLAQANHLDSSNPLRIRDVNQPERDAFEFDVIPDVF